MIVEQDTRGLIIWRERRTINLDLDKASHQAMFVSPGGGGEGRFRDAPRVLVEDSANGATGNLIIPVSQIQ